MSRARDNLTGQRFGRLVAQEITHTTHSGAMWRCLCDCGKFATVRAYSLKAGKTESCGCKVRRVVGGKRGMHTRMVLDQVFGAPPEPEVDRSAKTWKGAEDASATLSALWGMQ